MDELSETSTTKIELPNPLIAALTGGKRPAPPQIDKITDKELRNWATQIQVYQTMNHRWPI